MTFISELLITVFLTVLTLGSYIVWPSRWNLPAHLTLGLSVTAYIVPALFTDLIKNYDQEIVDIYIKILAFGSISFVTGLLIARSISFDPIAKRMAAIEADREGFRQLVGNRIVKLALLSTAGMIISFAIMGFIPILADNPFQAKFFKGEYQAAYHRAAWLYRLSFVVVEQMIPLVLMLWWVSRKREYLILASAMVLLMIAALTRGSAFSGILIFLGFVAASRGRLTFIIYLGFCIGSFIAGSVSYYIASLFIDDSIFSEIYTGTSFADHIASGAPDISDQLFLLGSFLDHGEYTYGRTFYGGLIPFNYKWNPAVWTLITNSPTSDIAEISSGGLRLPSAMWGFVDFGWIGVVVVPLLSGIIGGLSLKSISKYFRKDHLLLAAVLGTTCFSIVNQAFICYALSIYQIPNISMAIYLLLPRIIIGRKNCYSKKFGSDQMLSKS